MSCSSFPQVLDDCFGSRARAKAHFADLLERYGSPLLVLDLVKQTERRERESKVGRDYRAAIEHVNSTMPAVSPQYRVRFCEFNGFIPKLWGFKGASRYSISVMWLSQRSRALMVTLSKDDICRIIRCRNPHSRFLSPVSLHITLLKGRELQIKLFS